MDSFCDFWGEDTSIHCKSKQNTVLFTLTKMSLLFIIKTKCEKITGKISQHQLEYRRLSKSF